MINCTLVLCWPLNPCFTQTSPGLAQAAAQPFGSLPFPYLLLVCIWTIYISDQVDLWEIIIIFWICIMLSYCLSALWISFTVAVNGFFVSRLHIIKGTLCACHLHYKSSAWCSLRTELEFIAVESWILTHAGLPKNNGGSCIRKVAKKWLDCYP